MRCAQPPQLVTLFQACLLRMRQRPRLGAWTTLTLRNGRCIPMPELTDEMMCCPRKQARAYHRAHSDWLDWLARSRLTYNRAPTGSLPVNSGAGMRPLALDQSSVVIQLLAVLMAPLADDWCCCLLVSK